MFTTTLFVTDFLQQTSSLSPLGIGAAFLPMVAAVVATSTTVPSTLLPRLGAKLIVAAGLTLGAAAMFWLSRVDASSSYVTGVLGPLVTFGVAVGTTNSVAVNTATARVDPEDAGATSAMVNTMPQIGGAVATVLMSTVAAAVTASSTVRLPTSPTASSVAAVAGDTAAFRTASIMCIVGAVVCGALLRRPRAPHRPPTETTGSTPRLVDSGK